MAMKTQNELESLGVADAICGMTDEEVRSLVDEAYACGLVQTLQDVTTVLGRAEGRMTAETQQLPIFA